MLQESDQLGHGIGECKILSESIPSLQQRWYVFQKGIPLSVFLYSRARRTPLFFEQADSSKNKNTPDFQKKGCEVEQSNKRCSLLEVLRSRRLVEEQVAAINLVSALSAQHHFEPARLDLPR